MIPELNGSILISPKGSPLDIVYKNILTKKSNVILINTLHLPAHSNTGIEEEHSMISRRFNQQNPESENLHRKTNQWERM